MDAIAIITIVASGYGSKIFYIGMVYTCAKFDACMKMCTVHSRTAPAIIHLSKKSTKMVVEKSVNEIIFE